MHARTRWGVYHTGSGEPPHAAENLVGGRVGRADAGLAEKFGARRE